MNIKSRIRAWLEVPTLPEEVPIHDMINDAVSNAMEEAFNEWVPGSLFFAQDRHRKLRGLLRKYVNKEAEREGREAAIKQYNRMVKPESFIDEVIARIRRKQIK